ncbi:MAG: polysaccharide biosynthesis C-terminal domain-containing protein [Polymorphobacter sp.]
MKNAVAGIVQRLRSYAESNPSIPETVAAFAIKLVGAMLSFGFSFLVARHLGAAGSGSYALALTTATFAAGISLLGLDYVLLRTMAGDVREGNLAAARGAARTTLLVSALAAIIIGGIVAGVGAPLLALAVQRGLDQSIVYLAAIAVLPITINRVAVAALRGSGGVLAAQWLEGPQAMLISVAVLLIAITGNIAVDAFDVVLLYFSTVVVCAALAWLVYARKARAWPVAAPTTALPMIAQGWRISLVVLSRLVLDWAVLLSLGAYYSTFEVGQFRTAWQISALIMLLVSTFDTVAGPRIAAAWRVGDIANIRSLIRQSVFAMLLMSSPLFVIALGFPEWALGLFGPEFVAGAPALRILALGQLVNVVSGPIGTVMLMTGQERTSLYVAMFSIAVLLVLCFTLIPAFGLIGAALTTSIIIGSRTIVSYLLVRKSLRLPG